ncbi:Cytochrome c oxidase subunit 6 [Hanseniaspora vineae]
MLSRVLFQRPAIRLASVASSNVPRMAMTMSLRQYPQQYNIPSVASRFYSSANGTGHDEETFEEFTTRFEKEFDQAYDLFEVQRVLNNCFAYDLVPAPVVIEKALRAARRVNDLPTAVRVFEALRYKVENEEQYEAYLHELEDVRKELGIPLKEDLF